MYGSRDVPARSGSTATSSTILAGVHDSKAVAHVRDDRQVVAHEHASQAVLRPQAHEQIQHLGLDRDVERRVGPSRSRILGSTIRAWAMATPCRWPPES